MDSMQTSTNTVRKIASAVGTVITKATWSSMFCRDTNTKHIITNENKTICIKQKIADISNKLLAKFHVDLPQPP